MLRAAATAASILLLFAGAAGAQEAIPTAAGATPPDASKEPPPPPLHPPLANGMAPVQPGPCGTGPVPKVAPVNPDGSPAVDHDVHGDVSVGMDSRGGHYVQGAVCMPLGDNGAVAIDISQSQGGAGWRR